IILKYIPKQKKYDVRFTQPDDEEGFEKYLKRSEFKVVEKKKKEGDEK
ncbi:hypothetical protein LCGC14_3020800, partial [marine sediment metagenome]